MNEKNWYCTTCSQGFTRRYAADRHILNIHDGQATKVQRVDYFIGRLSGEFPQADPLAFRRRSQSSSNQSVMRYKHENLPSFLEAIGPSSKTGKKKTGIEEGLRYQGSFNNSRRAAGPPSNDRANGPNSKTGKWNSNSFPKTWPRFEEAKNILLSFTAPGEKTPLFIEQTLANLFSAILWRGGDDSFLEQTLKELQDMVSPIFATKVFGQFSPEGMPTRSRSEYTMQEQGRCSVPSITNVPQNAIDNLEEIKDLLIPFYSPELVQKRLDELITSYHQTGDSTIFKRALVYYLNRSPY